MSARVWSRVADASEKSNGENKIFDPAIYEGGNCDDEVDDKEDMWLPVSNTIEKYDYLEIVADFLWEELDVGEDLTLTERKDLLSLLKKHPEVFLLKNNRLGYCPLVEHHINKGNATPIREQLTRFSF